MGLNILIVYLERGFVINININIVIKGYTGMTFCTFGLHYYQYLDSGQKSEYKVTLLRYDYLDGILYIWIGFYLYAALEGGGVA